LIFRARVDFISISPISFIFASYISISFIILIKLALSISV
jgi:hypothetical protein